MLFHYQWNIDHRPLVYSVQCTSMYLVLSPSSYLYLAVLYPQQVSFPGIHWSPSSSMAYSVHCSAFLATLSSRVHITRSWWRSIVVRPLVLAGELSLTCARLTAGRVTTLWVKCPLSVNQHGQLSLPSLWGRLWMSSNPLMMGYEGGDLLLAGAACAWRP